MYKLLIVDDEYVEIEALTYIVKNSTLPIDKIFTASNGRQAIQLAKDYAPDIVLMDIKIPGISGTEAAAQIIEDFPHCKIVFLSAYNYFDYAQEAIRINAHDFLIKPVSNTKLIEVLGNLLVKTEKESHQRQLSTSIENQFKQISVFFENELINYLLFADIKEKQLNEYFQALNCQPSYIHSIVVSIDEVSLNNLSPLKSTIIKRRCIKCIKEHFNQYADRCFGNFDKNWLYLIILTSKPLEEDMVKDVLKLIQKNIDSNYHLNIRIAISDVIINIMGINRSLLSLKHELLFNEKNDQIVYPSYTYKTSNNFSPRKEQMLLEAIQMNNTAIILTISSEYQNWLKHASYDITEIKYLLFGMLSHIIKSMNAISDHSSIQLADLNITYIKKLENNNNIDTLLSCFTDQLLNIATIFSTVNDANDHPIITKLCDYINQNYMHNLSLKALADDLDMNSQYISKYFKENKGITFSDYLTDIRISKAKLLLLETRKSIQDIGLSVGYNDPNYFTRAFKKHEALTPNQYRLKAYRPASKDAN